MTKLHETVAIQDNVARVANYSLSTRGVEAGEADSAAVVGNAVLSFTTGITPQNKQDAMNTYLFATKVATHDFKEGKGEGWYNKFRQVMGTLGWVEIQNSYHQHTSKKQKFSMDEVAVEILKSALLTAALPGATGLMAVESARKAVETLKTKEGARTVLDRQVSSDKGGNFGLGSAMQTAEGDVILSLGSLHYTSDVNATNVVFSHWDSASIDLYQGATTFVMNPKMIDATRPTVERKLFGKVVGAVEEFELD
ncbi:hypothetical protein [Pseudomonas putida]